MFTQKIAKKIGREHDIPAAYVWAVVQTESSGTFSWGNGKIPILLERHKVYNYLLSSQNEKKAEAIYHQAPDICNPIRGGYGRSRTQYQRLAKAIKFAGGEAAHWGTSFGAFQIMGFNHKQAGFNTATDFANEMHKGAEAQINAWITFLKAYKRGKCIRALKKGDWARFAYYYNGPAYGDNNYDSKMMIAAHDFRATYEGVTQVG